jgi:hypothetical protein
LSSINGNAISGARNRIINGDCRIDQRNAGTSVTPANGAYTLDRWAVAASQTSKFTIQGNAGNVTPPVGFTSYIGATSSSSYSVAAGDYFTIYQWIEGNNISDLGWGTVDAKPVTLSFWVRSSLTGSFGGVIQGITSTYRTYPFTYTISSSNTWEYKTLTISGDTGSPTGGWPKNNAAGMLIGFGLGGGATYSGTSGSWSSNNYLSSTGATSVVGTNGATFYLTGVQLEAGSVATPFERRFIGQEIALCQRYYEKSFSLATVPANGASATALATNEGSVTGVAQNRLNVGPTVFFKVVKRAIPLMTKYGSSSGDWIYAAQNATSWTGSANSGVVRISESSFVVDQQVADASTILVSGHWTASAEL